MHIIEEYHNQVSCCASRSVSDVLPHLNFEVVCTPRGSVEAVWHALVDPSVTFWWPQLSVLLPPVRDGSVFCDVLLFVFGVAVSSCLSFVCVDGLSSLCAKAMKKSKGVLSSVSIQH